MTSVYQSFAPPFYDPSFVLLFYDPYVVMGAIGNKEDALYTKPYVLHMGEVADSLPNASTTLGLLAKRCFLSASIDSKAN